MCRHISGAKKDSQSQRVARNSTKQLSEHFEGVTSGRKKAHKHKLFALVNVQMALGQTAGCPRVNRAKKFMCSSRNTGNIKLFPLVNRRVVPGLSRFSKSLCVQSLCAFFLPYYQVTYPVKQGFGGKSHQKGHPKVRQNLCHTFFFCDAFSVPKQRPSVCQRWFLNGGSSLVRRANQPLPSLTSVLPRSVYLSLAPLKGFSTSFQFNLTFTFV